MFDLFQKSDISLLYAINHAHHPHLDLLFATLSNSEFFYPFILAITILLLLHKNPRARHLLALILISLFISNQAIIWPIKKIINRPRPHEVLPNIRSTNLEIPRISFANHSFGIPIIPSHDRLNVQISPIDLNQKPPPSKGRSFISGHAANNLSIAILSSYFYPSLTIPTFTWTLLISYSRVYNGSHYPSDILFGWIIAIITSWSLISLYKRFFDP